MCSKHKHTAKTGNTGLNWLWKSIYIYICISINVSLCTDIENNKPLAGFIQCCVIWLVQRPAGVWSGGTRAAFPLIYSWLCENMQSAGPGLQLLIYYGAVPGAAGVRAAARSGPPGAWPGGQHSVWQKHKHRGPPNPQGCTTAKHRPPYLPPPSHPLHSPPFHKPHFPSNSLF